MTDAAAERIAVEPAGAPGAAWLEMRGSILVYRRRSWVASFSAYLPVEWLERSDARRCDWQRLWQSVIALLIAILIALPLSLCYLCRDLLSPADLLWVVPLGILFLAMLGVCVARFGAFLVARPCTTLQVADAPSGLSVRIWRSGTAQDQQVETLLAQVAAARDKVARGLLPTLHMNHGWYQPDPYRMALLKGGIISFFLYTVLLAWALLAFLGGMDPLPLWCFAFLAAPPLFHFAVAAMRDMQSLGAPRAFRRARRHYRRGALEAARQDLDRAVDASPDNLAVHLLMVRVCAEMGALDAAMHHCGKISRERPLMAAALEENLWAIRRVLERMDVPPAHED